MTKLGKFLITASNDDCGEGLSVDYELSVFSIFALSENRIDLKLQTTPLTKKNINNERCLIKKIKSLRNLYYAPCPTLTICPEL